MNLCYIEGGMLAFFIFAGREGVEAMDGIGRVLLTGTQIQDRVKELGQEISRDYRGLQLLAVGVLKGAAIFLSDLAREISVPVSFDFIAVSSYGAATLTSGVVRILKDLDEGIGGRHVLLVEDIVDTGLTLNYLLEILRARNPATLKVCALLDKPGRRVVQVPIDYKGFEIPNQYVVGYGLDYGEMYRNLPYLAVLKGIEAEG